jgi:pyruvate, orthophosphate dikinase
MVSEGLINEREALLRIDAERMTHFLHPTIDPRTERTILAKGLPASPGATTGEVVFTPEEAEELAKKGKAVILVR